MVEKANSMSATVTRWLPHCPGRPWLNAWAVISAALSCSPVAGSVAYQLPVVIMTRPVKLTTIMVSMNVCVIDTKPCLTGWAVCAAAAAMAADPRPDSRSEEHTSELQSRGHLVCRLLLEKKKHRIT